MWSEHAPLGEKLRSAMGRAGIVEGYRHVCRRCKAGRKPDCEERHPDDALRRCKTCNMKLMACPVPRRLRFHDLRHTTASLLLASGVDLFAVQRILRHSDPKITSEAYAHLVPGYLHEAIDRLELGAAKFATPLLPESAMTASQCSEGPDDAPDLETLQWRAWQESNLRPAASKFVTLSLPQNPRRPVPSRFAGLALRLLPRTSRRTRTITESLLH